MYQEGHIGFLEAATLAFVLLSTKILVTYPSVMVQLGQTAAWFLVLQTAAWAALGFLLVAALLDRFPGRGLAEANAEVGGPVLGSVLNLVLVAWLVLDVAFMLRLFSETIVASLLPRTPLSVIILLAVPLTVYAGWVGLEALSRANLVLAPVLAVILPAVLVFTLNEARLDLLFPLWGPGPAPLLQFGVTRASTMSEVVLLAVYAYALRDGGTLRRAGLWALAISAAALALAVAVYVAIFGPEGGARQPFPFYELSRMVYLGRFVQRVESFFVLFWLLGAGIRLSVYLHAAAVTMAVTLGVPYYRPLLLPLVVVALAIGMTPADFTIAAAFHTVLRQWEALPAFLLPAALLLVARRRQRRPREVAADGD